jgi:adenosylcobinamide-phosphate synthase
MPPTGVATLAVLVAVALEVTLAEFPGRVHPVALFGRAVAPLDRAWRRPRVVGAALAVGAPLVFAVLAGGLVVGASRVGPLVGAAVAGLWLFASTSLRMLLGAAGETVRLSTTDLPAARESLLTLAGRDATDLDAGSLRSAAVESLAENLADGLVAPLGAFALCAQLSLAAGVAAAAWVKGLNTLDSMFGYREKPMGWAPARLDDLVMYLPARVSAALVAAAGLAPAALVGARRWAHAPPSPNSGWPMATLACLLGVELAKPGVYRLNPGAGLPDGERARRGLRTVGVAGGLAYLLVGVSVWF